MAQQIPDGDSTNWIIGGLGALATIVGTVTGAVVAIRKSRTETTQSAVSTAQTTVQASLEAMRSVVVEVTKELQRKQTELDEIRIEVNEVRKTNRRLEEDNVQRGIQMARITDVARQLRRRVGELERAQGIQHGGLEIRTIEPDPDDTDTELFGLDDAN